jgi:hypothetical protein
LIDTLSPLAYGVIAFILATLQAYCSRGSGPARLGARSVRRLQRVDLGAASA